MNISRKIWRVGVDGVLDAEDIIKKFSSVIGNVLLNDGFYSESFFEDEMEELGLVWSAACKWLRLHDVK